MELVVQLWVAGLIERARRRLRSEWKPGTPLRLLFVGYNGNRNTGSDVRVEEMLRQVRHLLRDVPHELSVLTYRPTFSRGYFKGARQLLVPALFPRFLAEIVPEHDGVIACEGSMFKSNFGSLLPTLMVGGLGLAAADGRLAVAYGGEAGRMAWSVRRLVARYVKNCLIITRNAASQGVLSAIGVSSVLGTDTAWTFEVKDPRWAAEALARAGWDGRTPVLGICPMNPFCWPLRPSLVRYVLHRLFGRYRSTHVRSFFFFSSPRGATQAFEQYLTALAEGVRAFAAARPCFPVIVGMEALDRPACEALARKLGGAPVFGAEQHTMYEIVGLLRACNLLVSSRYHALVTSMSAQVPSCGVSTDERIQNLMADREQPELVAEVGDPQLAARVSAMLFHLEQGKDAVQRGIARSVVRNLRTLGEMGGHFTEHLRQRYPAMPLPPPNGDWRSHLPPLSPALEEMISNHPD